MLKLGKSENILLFSGIVFVILTIIILNLLNDVKLKLYVDNIQCTVSFVISFLISYSAYKKSCSNTKLFKKYALIGMGFYVIAQFIWDIQTYFVWDPFPGINDYFFLSLPFFLLIGTFKTIKSGLKKGQHKNLIMDFLAIFFVVLSLVYLFFLPVHTKINSFDLLIYTLYPLLFLTVFSLFLVYIPTFKLKLSWSWIAFLISLIINCLVWITWNLKVINNEDLIGGFINTVFSLSALFMAYSLYIFDFESSPLLPIIKTYEKILRMIPILSVVIISLVINYTFLIIDIPNLFKIPIIFSLSIILIIATIRQSYLFKESDKLIDTERSLFESEEKFKLLFDYSTDGLLILDNDVFIDCNKKSMEMLGTNEKKYVLRKPEIISPEYQINGVLSSELAPKNIKLAVQNNWTRFEWIHLKENGEEIQVEVTLIKIPFQGRNIFYTMWKDISELKENERKINEYIAMQTAIFNSSLFAIISTDKNGIIKSYNKTAEKWLGYTAAEIVDKVTPILFHDQLEVVNRAEEINNKYNISINNLFDVFVFKAKMGSFEQRIWNYIRKDGSKFKVELSVTSLVDSNNQIIGFLGMANDISEKLANQNKAEKSELKFRKTLESLPVSIIQTDNFDNIDYINNQFINDFGYTLEMIPRLDNFCSFLMDHQNIDKCKEGLSITVNIVCLNNSIKTIQIQSIILEHSRIYTLYDITELVNAQYEVIKINKELEIRVEERTKKLEYLNNELSEFAYIISHDLKAPLRGVNQIASGFIMIFRRLLIVMEWNYLIY